MATALLSPAALAPRAARPGPHRSWPAPLATRSGSPAARPHPRPRRGRASPLAAASRGGRQWGNWLSSDFESSDFIDEDDDKGVSGGEGDFFPELQQPGWTFGPKSPTKASQAKEAHREWHVPHDEPQPWIAGTFSPDTGEDEEEGEPGPPAGHGPPLVKDFMSPHPVVVPMSMKLAEVCDLFLARGVSGCPVVDDEGAMVGIISETDLVWKEAMVPKEHFVIPPTYIPMLDLWVQKRDEKAWRSEIDKILAATAGEAMTTGALVVHPDQPVSDAAVKMLNGKVNRLPVTDEKSGKVVGIITRSDLMRCYLVQCGGVLTDPPEEIKRPPRHEVAAGEDATLSDLHG